LLTNFAREAATLDCAANQPASEEGSLLRQLDALAATRI